jgi:hypothetical protein
MVLRIWGGWLRVNEPPMRSVARGSFINRTLAECLHDPADLPEHERISAKVIADYCRCYGWQLASRISYRESKDYSAGRREALRPRIDAASRACIAVLPLPGRKS